MIKYLRILYRKEEAISIVIALVLIAAVAVACATMTYVFVSGMIGGISQKSSLVSLDLHSQNDTANITVWVVTDIEGEPVKDGNYATSLLFENGSKDYGAKIIKQEIVGSGFLNVGDTFMVEASQDGRFVFTITDTLADKTIFKSILTQY
jgi:FlaG/FlaF family flagellin (archaellin)